jgi:hypothetical protein
MQVKMDETEIGVVICCGRKLDWIAIDDCSVMAVNCPRCGTIYTMDASESLEALDEVGLEPEVVRVLLRNAQLRDEQTEDGPSIFGFAA